MCDGSQPSAPWSGEDFATGRASHHERPFCGGSATWRRSAAPAAFRSVHGLTGRSSACPQLAVRFRREPSSRASGALKQLPSPSEGRFPFVPHRLRSVKPFSSAPRLVPRPFGEARSPQDVRPLNGGCWLRNALAWGRFRLFFLFFFNLPEKEASRSALWGSVWSVGVVA